MTSRLGMSVLAALAIIAAPLSAQPSGTNPPRRVFLPVSIADSMSPIRENLISVNPLGLVFQYFSGEFEHAVSRSNSIAVSGSYTSPFNITYTSVDLIGRYYPSELGLRGFAIGATAGYTHVKDDYSCYGSCSNASSNAVTAGVQLDYSWVLGPSQHFGIELGIGAKRLFYQGKTGRGSDALPTGRLSVGYAF